MSALYSGETLTVELPPSGTARAAFARADSPVNKFDRTALEELREAVDALAGADGVKGAVFASARPAFVVGADIGEFTELFRQPPERLLDWLARAGELFNAVEDLPFPTVAALGGAALGGGFELALAADYRVAVPGAAVGFPEVKLGIIPGFGGTVRLPRLIGADNAAEWIAGGARMGAERALRDGAVDAVVEPEALDGAAERLLDRCAAGKLDFRRVRERKRSPLLLPPEERETAFGTALAAAAAKAGPHYPAPAAAVAVMRDAAAMDRAGALEVERRAFVRLARTETAANLVRMFLNERLVARRAREAAAGARPVGSIAVLGAGIMGGGIAFQAALKRLPAVMGDAAPEGLERGMAEIRRQLERRLARGALDAAGAVEAMGRVRPTLGHEGFERTDLAVEAVVEDAQVKKRALAELEARMGPEAVIASNTSTISISELGDALRRPERFCGMHFFNPVPAMPLVEIVRGRRSGEEALAAAAACARRLGKTPIMVRDCPGFLVNRILFPYFGAFELLLRDGADFRRVDEAMERFGWPMGPARLLDVVGIDTAARARQVMAEGFERMAQPFAGAMEKLRDAGRLGQKSGRGFYRYEPGPKGRLERLPDPEADGIVGPARPRAFDEAEIVERMMTPLCLESARCLEDGIVETAVEVDMGLALGLGFPAFRGGALRHIDGIGVAAFREMADRHAGLGPLYHPTEAMRARAEPYHGRPPEA